MAQYSWSACPDYVRNQALDLVADLRTTLREKLIGIYLHGSLATGCFNPACSDIDILALTFHQATLKDKHQLAECLLAHSANPIPIEISFVGAADIHPWKYPTPYDFHFSEEHREQIKRDLATGHWRNWNKKRLVDTDLATHIRILKERGILLTGPSIRSIFPDVPDNDFRASILRDFKWAAGRMDQRPMYATLNTCRCMVFVKHGTIMSKQEAAEWALDFLPQEFTHIVSSALEGYLGEGRMESVDSKEVASLIAYARRIILGPTSCRPLPSRGRRRSDRASARHTNETP
jgi:predicted nucleotidyltransferase